MNWQPATNPEHALERVRTGLGATHSQKASTRPATYAHHGRIRCYTWRRSTLGAVQRWDAYCACGWRTENCPSHRSALAGLRMHQILSDPRWMVFLTPMRAPVTVRSTVDTLDRVYNTASRRNQ